MIVQDELVLSLAPGIGLFDKGFENIGYCVVRGPDTIWGADIKDFHPPPGRFQGLIAGTPCQDFSKARRALEPSGNGIMMINQFIRCVEQAQPIWYLLENVPGVPDVKIDGYSWQRLDLTAREFGLTQTRLRHIQFGSKDGTLLVRDYKPAPNPGPVTPTITATDTETPFAEFCQAMGLPADFDIPAFTIGAKRRAIGNAVPLPMATALAEMVRDRQPADTLRLCACNCARPIRLKQTYANSSCRMRAMRRRQSEQQLNHAT